MNTWTAIGPAEPAGDHFGDDEACDARALTFTNPAAPYARVSVYFGVIHDPKVGRYTAVSDVEMELLDAHHQPTQSHTMSQNELFLYDHDRVEDAVRDMNDELKRWRTMRFDRTMLGFDGTDFPPDH